jgi:autotransporter strand-loop-strand O-heptosyltransferase
MKQELIHEYNTLKNLRLPLKKPSNTFKINFIEGAFVEIVGDQSKQYKVIIKDLDTGKIIHNTVISNNMWTRTNIKYFIHWGIQVYDVSNNELVFEHNFNPEGKRVYIHLDSSAIGDTLAWFPYVEEFRKKWKCQVVISTFKNDWFIPKYPELEFITPGKEVLDLYAMYGLGWFYNDDRTFNSQRLPRDFKPLPLQQTATEILGLNYKEVRPILNFPDTGRPIEEKYVVIAPHASAHAKYWNHPGGWQEVIDVLNEKGYKVMMITHESATDDWHNSKLGNPLKNVIDETGDFPIEKRMNQIKHAEAFIGVGSGLSWLAWAIQTPVVMISGFSESYTEFEDCERVSTPQGLCTGCFNREWLNPGDWEWCPDHKDTPRQFECTKSIMPSQVLKSIQNVLHF